MSSAEEKHHTSHDADQSSPVSGSWSKRKTAYLRAVERLAPDWDKWIARNGYFHGRDAQYMRFLIPEDSRVLELGSATGWLLDELSPAKGVGVDFSAAMTDQARTKHPRLTFLHGDIEDREFMASLEGEGPFDYIILSDTVGYLDDIIETLKSISRLCQPHTRLVVSHYSHLWEPVLRVAEAFGLRKKVNGDYNWLSPADIEMFLRLSGFETVKKENRQLLPKRLLGLGTLVNRFIAPLPLIRGLCVRTYAVARSADAVRATKPSVSVVVPARNEQGNIAPAIRRIPDFGAKTEIIFVEGHSKDGTWDEILRQKEANPSLDIVAIQQPGKGKADAVWAAFDIARGDILMILDGDLTVPPEDLGKFYDALASGTGEFVNGTRLVYPLEKDAMRFLNYLANRTFARIFSYLLNQRFSDTLCGTKVLYRLDYQRLKAGRAYFGDFDPFGDFDLLFGAAKLNLKIVEVPVRYEARAYGETQISRFRHGLLLLQMVVFAFRKLKMI
ncbi:undecaprenyl-phosphate 4-deoxy-4-formamido-L-arabinose transferase [bacterium BMS3Bbin10]|nr:undecaprenyl-phosphate 4-deoxy-4-formamido-L-arabinose transferase [bacterium BMS3Bbin10]